MNARRDVTVRIDRLVVETRHPVNAFGLQRALGAAVREVLLERGVPEAWSADIRTPVAVLDGLAWTGLGGELELARALAERLYEGALS
jgi:hypothetical protein